MLARNCIPIGALRDVTCIALRTFLMHPQSQQDHHNERACHSRVSVCARLRHRRSCRWHGAYPHVRLATSTRAWDQMARRGSQYPVQQRGRVSHAPQVHRQHKRSQSQRTVLHRSQQQLYLFQVCFVYLPLFQQGGHRNSIPRAMCVTHISLFSLHRWPSNSERFSRSVSRPRLSRYLVFCL